MVDLAGSENIGRSGAENKRAKEAGMINQSLLTLGRVINALVDRSPHIPYRESKLTRILQDSLGGRTKTCIIAALSPARCNIEESLSTLDYAHRAKNIKNKPEINQKMTKRALIKEYITQIDRLKADLQATRDKNGIFLSQESYNSLLDESASRKDQVDEAQKSMDATLEEMKILKEKFEQQMSILDQTSVKLEETMSELRCKEEELNVSIEKSRTLQKRLVEQYYVAEYKLHNARAHSKTEENLANLANGLVCTLKSSVGDLGSLHEKLERKSNIERENLILFQSFRDDVMQRFEQIRSVVENLAFRSSDLVKMSSSNSDILSDVLKEVCFYSIFYRSHYQQIKLSVKTPIPTLSANKTF